MKADLALPYATPQARASALHGPAHWESAASFGAQLSRETPGADAHVVAIFAALHDTQRLGDGPDPDHGRRAAALAPSLRGKVFEATDEQLATLMEAIAKHADGHVTQDPTIGCCWDADRLDLPRCGIEPDPAMLSTAAAKRELTTPAKKQVVDWPIRAADAVWDMLLDDTLSVNDSAQRSHAARSTHPLYLRFGDLPPGGRSSTWRREVLATGQTPPMGFDSYHFPQSDFEVGVSCFRARKLPGAGALAYEVDVSPSLDQAMLYRLFARAGRPVYLVEGTEVASGFIDEPVLEGARAEPLPVGAVVTCSPHFSEHAANLEAQLHGVVTETRLRVRKEGT